MSIVYPSLACLVAAFSSAVLGFGILNGSSAATAKGLFVLFIILSLALLGRRRKKKLLTGSSYAQWARAEEPETPRSTILDHVSKPPTRTQVPKPAAEKAVLTGPSSGNHF